MELSEAIRKGSKLRPQTFNETYGTAADGSFGTCAVGAAYEAVGRIVFTTEADGGTQVHLSAESPSFPLLYEYYDEPLPCGCKRPSRITRLLEIIAHLNDEHRWPRERIASWVRHVEKK